jgi:hypothetical protein
MFWQLTPTYYLIVTISEILSSKSGNFSAFLTTFFGLAKWKKLSHYVLAISPGQKWWQTILKIKVSCSQWEGSACTHEAPSFFLWGGGGGLEERDFLFFPCSQSVPIVFPWDSQVVPQDVSKSTSDLSHMVCPRFNSHLSMKQGSLFCFCFVLMRSTEPRCFRSCTYCLWKALNEYGCMGLVPWHLDLQCKSSWILNDFLTKN